VVDPRQLAAAGSGDRFSTRLALGRLGAFGHSMGGITSAAFCAQDKRCRAALNLDGSPQYGDLIDHPGARPFLMVYAARPGRIGVSDLVYGRSDSAWRAVIDGTFHLNFGDFQYREGPQRLGNALGPIAADRATAIVHRLVRMVDQFLGKTSTLLAGERSELEVRRYRSHSSAREMTVRHALRPYVVTPQREPTLAERSSREHDSSPTPGSPTAIAGLHRALPAAARHRRRRAILRRVPPELPRPAFGWPGL
jgi:pimeloyl-ACP methyl ester carboxylesterase